MADTMIIHQIGAVRRGDAEVWLEIDDPYLPALASLDLFSHVIVLWWASEHGDEGSRQILQTQLPYAPGVTAGVFACRAEYRPNPIAISTCKLLDVDEDEGIVRLATIDAYDGSPVLDLKPYIGVVDRVENVGVPEWFDGWPEWMPDEGIGLYEE